MNEPCNCCGGPTLVTCEDCEGKQWEFNVLAIPALVEMAPRIIAELRRMHISAAHEGSDCLVCKLRDEAEALLAELKAP